jgi:hypothetical protein
VNAEKLAAQGDNLKPAFREMPVLPKVDHPVQFGHRLGQILIQHPFLVACKEHLLAVAW